MKNTVTILALLIVGYVYGQENYQIKNLDINTKYSDFGVAYYGTDAIFASAKKVNNKSFRNWLNGQPYLDLYKGAIDIDGEILDGGAFSENIATKYHEANAVFTKDLKTVYFTRNNYFEGHYGKDSLGWNNLKLFRASIDQNGNWLDIISLPFNDDNYSVGHPALSNDERTLYFVSDMPGSMGRTDIFTSKINADGTYGPPMNMSSQVNTFGKEMFPYVSKKGNLYFSSDSREGQGDLDVYVVPLNNKTVKPINLGFPINSTKDDFAFIIDNDTKNGYFSSNRSNGHGDDDIYYFDELNAPNTSCMQVITGSVRDKSNGFLLSGSEVSLYKGSEKIETITVGSNATYTFSEVYCNTTYRITGDKEHYKHADETVYTTNDADLELGFDLNLLRDKVLISYTETLDRCQFGLDNINTIYFDFNAAEIRSDAVIELEKIIKVMNKCEDIIIEAGSHTDSRASQEHNMKLSQRRAQGVVDYLVSRGIAANRVSAKSYGETQLLNKCSDGVPCSKAEHQVNRRIEFVIDRE